MRFFTLFLFFAFIHPLFGGELTNKKCFGNWLVESPESLKELLKRQKKDKKQKALNLVLAFPIKGKDFSIETSCSITLFKGNTNLSGSFIIHALGGLKVEKGYSLKAKTLKIKTDGNVDFNGKVNVLDQLEVEAKGTPCRNNPDCASVSFGGTLSATEAFVRGSSVRLFSRSNYKRLQTKASKKIEIYDRVVSSEVVLSAPITRIHNEGKVDSNRILIDSGKCFFESKQLKSSVREGLCFTNDKPKASLYAHYGQKSEKGIPVFLEAQYVQDRFGIKDYAWFLNGDLIGISKVPKFEFYVPSEGETIFEVWVRDMENQIGSALRKTVVRPPIDKCGTSRRWPSKKQTSTSAQSEALRPSPSRR